MPILFDVDEVSGIVETFDKDQSTGKIHIKKTQEVDSLFNSNTSERTSAKAGWQGDFHKVASVPLIVVEMWRDELKAKGVPNPDPLHKDNKIWLIAKLNSRDFQKLRTKEGMI